MNALRLAFGTCCMLLVAGFALADVAKKDGPTKEKLVGVWEAKEGELPKGSTVEFTKGGKLKVTVKINDQTISVDGTWELDGDKLKTVHKEGDKEVKETITIKTLTDKELVTEDEKGKVDKFTKK